MEQRLSEQPQRASLYNTLAMVWSDVVNELARVLRPLRRPIPIRGREWNLLRTDAWLWGRENPRLIHGMSWSGVVQVMLVLAFTLDWGGCFAEYDYIPFGGGSNEAPGKTVVVKQMQKPKKKVKYVVSKWSPISFTVPDITEWTKKWDEQLSEDTRTRYATGYTGSGTGSGPLGQGEGEGAGFGQGNWKGMVRFMRIQYRGGDWNNNMGKGADWNMLIEFNILSGGIKVAKESESRTIAELNNFAKFNSPPFVYITGHFGLDVNPRETEMLRKYLLDKHGMIFADASGPGWGRKFMDLMRRVLPDVQPIYIPFDDPIHRRPFPMAKLPYVAPHDPPMMARGWKKDGRWVAYYHPGDLADAWKDGHSGVKKDVARASYELGVNVMYYAYREYSEWLMEQKRKQ